VGPPFGTAAAGSIFAVPVRIQASPILALTAFQVVVTFDATKVRVDADAACVQGASWGSTWTCTTNDPVNEVLIAGSCGISPSIGCGTTGLLTVATITFRAIAEGSFTFSADIVKLKDDSVTTANKVAVAGTDSMVITASRRLTEARRQNDTLLEAAPSAARARIAARADRRLAVPCDQVLGDTNGDCVCDVLDVQYLQHYIGLSTPAFHSFAPGHLLSAIRLLESLAVAVCVCCRWGAAGIGAVGAAT
jgi:hypothetical protein